MPSTAAALDQVTAGLRDLTCDDTLAGLSDADRMHVLRQLGEASRLLDAALAETVSTADVEFGHSFGCRGMNELLQRTLLTDAKGAGAINRAADRVHREVNLLSGERMPAAWPALREALLDGAISLAGLLAATGPLEQAKYRIGAEERLWADETLAAYARGYQPADADAEAPGEPGPPLTPEDLRQAASVLAMALDPDGAEPTDRAAQNSRYLTIGRLKNGLRSIRGDLLPEVAAQLDLIIDAHSNPKTRTTAGVAFAETEDAGDSDDPFNSDDRAVIDPRTPAQKRHDALAAALGIAARHAETPSSAGAPPTVVVHVDAKDLATGAGWATVDDAPVPLAVAAQTVCTGAVQRILFDEGRIIGISSTDRVFTIHQRRAIIARDRECLIPGCHVPASWCEIHHVTEHARGGPTHTDNGVPLCWWHHRSLGQSGWEIRMADGMPQVRGPAWWDPTGQWRTPTLSLHRHPLKT